LTVGSPKIWRMAQQSVAVTIVQIDERNTQMKTIRIVSLLAAVTVVGAVAALAADVERLDTDTGTAIQTFRGSGPRMQQLFDTAYGYVVFPSVDKGAAGVGAAEGRGLVYQGGALVGRAKLTQVTVGAQLGGQSYSEVIFFENARAFQEFEDGKTAISAGLSAVAAADSASAEAKYQHGVIVRTMDRSGLMFEASVGGQHFTFRPIDADNVAPRVTQTPPDVTTAPSAPIAPPPAQ
jgi:lipid-binding SYLF domain-containing protein